jgi:hypothetical protein
MNSTLLRMAVPAVLLVAAGASGSCSAPDSPAANTTTPTEADPMASFEDLSPSDFVDTIDNPYFPKLPGTRWVYEGMTADGLERNESEVPSETFEIEGWGPPRSQPSGPTRAVRPALLAGCWDVRLLAQRSPVGSDRAVVVGAMSFGGPGGPYMMGDQSDA